MIFRKKLSVFTSVFLDLIGSSVGIRERDITTLMKVVSTVSVVTSLLGKRVSLSEKPRVLGVADGVLLFVAFIFEFGAIIVGRVFAVVSC